MSLRESTGAGVDAVSSVSANSVDRNAAFAAGSPPTSYADHEAAMRRALEIAVQGRGRAEPNPLVGAVVVSADGQHLAEGFHRHYGSAHAEINALTGVQGLPDRVLREATLYVTLEPCSHHGKTPPCADAVVASGIRRVMVGCPDPASHVNGRGIRRLQGQGIDVRVGVLETAARCLIAPFVKMQSGRSWVHAKWAMSLDGRIAARTGHSQWITGEAARTEVHRLRGLSDVILTGAGTVRADDPLLTARSGGPRQPLRVVLDGSGESLTSDRQLVKTAVDYPTIVFVNEACTADTERRLQKSGLEVVRIDGDRDSSGTGAEAGDGPGQLPLRSVLQELADRGKTHVFLEAGAGIQGAFFDAGLVDEVHAFVAPRVIGGSGALSPVGGLGVENVKDGLTLVTPRIRTFPPDWLIEGDVVSPG